MGGEAHYRPAVSIAPLQSKVLSSSSFVVFRHVSFHARVATNPVITNPIPDPSFHPSLLPCVLFSSAETRSFTSSGNLLGNECNLPPSAYSFFTSSYCIDPSASSSSSSCKSHLTERADTSTNTQLVSAAGEMIILFVCFFATLLQIQMATVNVERLSSGSGGYCQRCCCCCCLIVILIARARVRVRWRRPDA